RRDLVAELFDDAADFRDLLGIAGGELARPDIERDLEADAHVAAHHGGVSAKIRLVAAAGEHRPQVLVAESPVGRLLHKHEIVVIRAAAAENSEDKLQKDRRL